MQQSRRSRRPLVKGVDSWIMLCDESHTSAQTSRAHHLPRLQAKREMDEGIIPCVALQLHGMSLSMDRACMSGAANPVLLTRTNTPNLTITLTLTLSLAVASCPLHSNGPSARAASASEVA